MKTFLRWWTVAVAGATTMLAAEAPNPWIADFERYAAQLNIQNDRKYPDPSAPAPTYRFASLIAALPAPEAWPKLREDLAAAAAAAPAGVRRQQLEAGAWLITYLNGDVAALKTALPENPHVEGARNAKDDALTQLRQALEETPAWEPESKDALKRFEDELATLEPVDDAAVKKALGGEENFARLQKLMAGALAMRDEMAKVEVEYEKTKDEAAARSKATALQQEFESKYRAEREAIAPYFKNPLLMSFLRGQAEKSAGEFPVMPLHVPDLVKLAGPERAEQDLRRALKLKVTLELRTRSGETNLTAPLARKLALEEIATLKAPSWELAQDRGAGERFKAFEDRFPDPKLRDYNYERAAGFYLAGLIADGKTKEAVAFAEHPERKEALTLPYDELSGFEERGQGEELWQYLRIWLERHPATNEWDRFYRLSAALGHENELRTLVTHLAANDAFKGLDRLRVQRMQASAELAVGDFDAAAKRLAALVQAPALTAEERSSQVQVGLTLVELAALRNDDAGVSAAQAQCERMLADPDPEHRSEWGDGMADLMAALNGLGRYKDAARLGRTVLTRVAEFAQAAARKGADESHSDELSNYEVQRALVEQLRALVELGLWPEAQELIDRTPWWGADDLSGHLDTRVSSSGRPLGYYFAQIALHAGDRARARKVLEYQLVATPGADSVYAAYLDLAGDDAKPLLAKLTASDRYEERPLIWRAKLESDAGQWDAAIATLQQAISVDPSDGEQGRGDRMRVYAFLSRAVLAKGDKEKSAFLDNVVKSIRLSETADRWFEIGAYAKAISLYREALTFFQDAYCIQSRLAVRLAGENKLDEAAEHYQRAFELMPDSFGRVESHCFGCEHVFAGKKSQGVAEKVFLKMLAARPERPQLHYLMGYLRQEQERYAEAADYYRKAATLDPLYLNAWDKLADLESHVKFSPTERDDLLLKLVELDPMRRHATPSLDHVSNIPRLWRAMEASQKVVADLPTSEAIWPLPASAEHRKANPGFDRSSYNERPTAATVVEEKRFVQAVQGYLVILSMPEATE